MDHHDPAAATTDGHDDLRAALEAERATVGRRWAGAEDGARALAAARGDSDGDDEHDPEGSTISWDLAAHRATTAASRRHLEEIEAALARLDAGWDGTCAGCGRPIPRARLVARPSAQRCVPCASAAQERTGRSR